MNLKLIQKLCRMNVPSLKKLLIKYLYSKKYTNIIKNDDYIIAEGDLPVCLIAHMDTVFYSLPTQFFFDANKKVLWSPEGAGFDDRAGIYAILMILESGYKPSIIFTNLEESGCLGAEALIKNFPKCLFKECKFLIELDRANKNDCVFYDCDNSAFENYIKSFEFETDWGTFSDISTIAPAWEIAAVNLSVGYYLEHTKSEYLKCNELDETINKVKKILDKSLEAVSYTYIPCNYFKTFNSTLNHLNVNGLDDDEDLEKSCLNKCLICGEKQNNFNKIHYISDPEYPYIICDSCFNQYYI